jgi:hypothetical protein
VPRPRPTDFTGVEVPPYERTPISTKLTSRGAQTRALKGSRGAVKCPSWLKMHYKVLIRKVQALNCSHRLHAMSGLSSRVRNRGKRVSPCRRRDGMCDLKESRLMGLPGPSFGQIAVGRCTTARAFDCAASKCPRLTHVQSLDQALNWTRGSVIKIPNH